jgi:ribosomal subunit interface protein
VESETIERSQEANLARLLARLDDRARAEADEITRALTRMALGDYGRCERCHAPIALARLQALPATSRCRPCAEGRAPEPETRLPIDVEIQTQHVELQPQWTALIDERLGKLAERYPEMLRVHVTFRHGGHHLHGTEEVDVVANSAGQTLRAAKREETMAAALHAALDALERQLAARHTERRRFEKAPGPRSAGTVASVFTDRGYGFIRTTEGEEVYFHRHALHELDFESLTPGVPVELEIEAGRSGPQAARVFPPGERSRT